MKFYSTLILVLVLIGWGVEALNAQSRGWKELDPIVGQADMSTRDTFAVDLEILTEDFELEEIPWQELISNLLDIETNLDDDIFGLPVDPLTVEWAAGLDTLNGLLGNSDLESADSMEVADQYQNINDTWNNSLDSFSNTLNIFDGPLDLNPDIASEGFRRYEIMTGLRRQSGFILRRSVQRAQDGSEPLGIGNLKEALDTLFSTMFDLELAFGKETGTVNYYSQSYDPTATVVRVGSIPAFDRAWEAKWHVQAAFMQVEESQFGENVSINEGLNPLRYGGNFSFMFNPAIGRIRAGGQFRLYTSLGMEVDTYAPAHINPGNPSTLDNVGNTTGFGPQIGSGFIVSTPVATLYTYGTITYGRVANCPSYNYRGQTFHAGLRIGNTVNFRYEQGKANWAMDENKSFTYSRFTLGLLLADLFR